MSESAILCVDDEVVILDSLKEQLKRMFGDRFIYEVAESADEAWEVIEELQADNIDVIIIVSDWLMPGTKGDEFLIQIHQHFPHLKKIMLTGQADEAAIKRAKIEANLHACMYKPWTEKELGEIINSAVN
ncbi:MAG: response regulator [Cyanobacteria bacterium P01_G01_bin.19]